MKKTRGRKSRVRVPLNTVKLNAKFSNEYLLFVIFGADIDGQSSTVPVLQEFI
jgi:hypothetical protein